MCARIGVIDSIHGFCHENDARSHLKGPLGCRGVCGEERCPQPSTEDDHSTFFEVADGSARYVGLRDLTHSDGRLYPCLDVLLLEEVLEGKAIHHRAQHAHVVSTSAIHTPLGELGTPEVVAPADDHGDLGPRADDSCDLPSNGLHNIGINPEITLSGECLTGQFEEHPIPATLRGLRPREDGAVQGRLDNRVL